MTGSLRTGTERPSVTLPPAARVEELAQVPALGPLYRHALTTAGRRATSRRIGGGAGPAPSLPGVAYAAHGVQADADRLTAYQHLVGEPATDTLPAGFVHVLTFPLATALMVRDGFPLPALGMVHLANRVEQRSPLRLGDRLDVRAWATGLRPHRSGTQVDLVTEAGVDGTTAWRGVSTYLAKGVHLADGVHPADGVHLADGVRPAGGGDRPDDEQRDDERPDDEHQHRPEFVPPVPTASWRLPADTGRRYAAVSGDVNPIHLWSPAARMFGFRGVIAHGMYTAARALAVVGAARGEAFTWSVDFSAPVVLPSTVAVRVARDPDGAGHTLSVWDPRRRRPHLTGSVTPPVGS